MTNEVRNLASPLELARGTGESPAPRVRSSRSFLATFLLDLEIGFARLLERGLRVGLFPWPDVLPRLLPALVHRGEAPLRRLLARADGLVIEENKDRIRMTRWQDTQADPAALLDRHLERYLLLPAVG